MNIADIKLGGQSQATTPDAAALARHANLADAAEKFEGMMLEELLKPMQQAGSVTGGGLTGEDDDPGRDSSLDTFSSYGVEAMAEALAKNGGLGLAKQVMSQIGNQIGNAGEKYPQTSSSTKV